ncbi:hypothetical protein Pcinc_040129 [Petrolisthes cinctipes]|uniref:Major facilitator superfamily (MFS) profile domain-containing protein n=1 Tax=Petrolisthes cinctipes TaxID=88211 RepID=A0AAE1BMU6_PETCI|nr:hypothetical protein Pcinc_040129 [Petrolisthes cinctipes]
MEKQVQDRNINKEDTIRAKGYSSINNLGKMTEETCETHELKKKDGLVEDGPLTAMEMNERVGIGNEEPRGERRARLTKQVGLISLVSLSYVALGSTLTWSSPAISSLSEDNSTLVGTEISLSSSDKDMAGSLLYLGMLVGAWVAGGLVAKLGRRLCLQLIMPLYVTGWVICGLAPTAAVLHIGRFVQGVAAGATTIGGYAYVVELADTNIRGNMAAMPTLGVVVGNLYTVALGYYLSWHYLSLVCVIPPIVFLVSTYYLPKSPSFLVLKGQRQQALSMLRKLRGKYANVEAEVMVLEKFNVTGNVGYRGLLERDVLKRLGVVIFLFLLSQMCGNIVFLAYTARILENTGVVMDPDAITALAGTLRVAGTVVAIVLLDVLGRRYCLIISHTINTFCLVILGIYVYLAENAKPDDDTYEGLTWIPATCVILALFFCDLGVHPVPFIVSSEYFSTKIRAQASSVCISAGTGITFMTLQLYTPMQTVLTQAGLYWFYAATSVIGIIFSYLCVIETKGKSTNDGWLLVTRFDKGDDDEELHSGKVIRRQE